PLFYEFPNVKDEDCEDQFLLGSSILAAPVFERKAANRRVNLPDAGEGWFDFDTGVVRDAGRHTYSTRPGMYPLLVRAGTALPMAVVGRNALDTMKSPLAFEIFPGTQISGKCILDDGISADGRNARIEVSGKKDRSGSIQLEVQVRENGFSPFQKTIRLRLPGNYRTATQKGKRIEGVPFDLTQEDRVGTAMQFEIPLENQKIEFDFRA
ncbi:MAG TPA: glycoside hydrolase family 31 protein, partial [Leptospiraceae bacterium]|nr:glycoside hydrolase family 31 protein [Leptospiraceae bacterium]